MVSAVSGKNPGYYRIFFVGNTIWLPLADQAETKQRFHLLIHRLTVCYFIGWQQFKQTELFRDTGNRFLETQSGSVIHMDVTRQYLEWLNARDNMISNHSCLGSLLWILGQKPGIGMGVFQVMNYS